LKAQTTKGLGGREPNMLIIGRDYRPGFQHIAFVNTDTGELGEQRFDFSNSDALFQNCEVKVPLRELQRKNGVRFLLVQMHHTASARLVE
jgi:hypothetical protein